MRLWLRWSVRDLRRRWVQVVAIAFIIALGSGIYSGLSSTSAWRRASYDASFEQLHMYDLHVALADGSYLDSVALVQAARAIPHAEQLGPVEARLLVQTQVDASRPGETILVPGRLVGVDVTDGGPHVNGVSAEQGRTLRASDAGADVAVLEAHFADHYDLPSTGQVEISGGTTLDYVGHGFSPEYFLVGGEQGLFLAEANFAAVFTSIETAQGIAGRPGQANDLVVRLTGDADADLIRQELKEALAERFPDVGVEAQRREIGVGMALGVPPRRLATRPMLVALEIALLGVLFGIGVGYLIMVPLAGVYENVLPLPVWEFPFQPATFARGAALGLLIPFAATLYPVWRALRVTPVQAIRTGFLTTKTSGLAPLVGRLPVPGRTTAQLPFRNVLRAPRRTVMTVLGIAAAITVLVALVGVVDSFFATMDEADDEISHQSPDRVEVALDSFYLADAEQVRAIESSPLAGAVEPVLEVGGTVRSGDAKIDTLVELRDLDSSLWAPTIEDRQRSDGPGIVLTEVAAEDLGVEPGDVVTLRHPRREGLTSYRFVDSDVLVLGTNPFPLRVVSFMDLDDAALMNLEGIVNAVVADPAVGVSVSELQRGLFGTSGVASVQPSTAFVDAIRDELSAALGVLFVVEAAVLLLALLIAFNSASINSDERAREHATMFAFGLRLRTVLRMAIVESGTIGVLATGAGIAAGWLLLDWLVQSLIPDTLPDLGIVTFLAPSTVLTAVILGTAAVALAPLLTGRKLRRMDIPSTLRVME